MADEYKELLSAIEKEFTQLRYRWELFRQLFDSGQEKVDLLNKSGSNVFQLLQKLIIDDTMMTLCRLSDRASSMGYENASIRNLCEKTKGILPEETNKEIETKLLELNEHMTNILTLRNKALSHTDFTHALNTELLPRPTYDELERSIDVVKNILNAITEKLSGYRISYVPLMPIGYDGNKLLNVLAKAHGFKQSES